MKYLINGTLRPDKPRTDLLARLRNAPLSEEGWELVRTRVITEHGFKTGQPPGFIFVVAADSEAAAQAAIARIPILREDWFDIEVDPISPFRSDIHEL